MSEKPTIYIEVRGGTVINVYADTDCRCVLIDYDEDPDPKSSDELDAFASPNIRRVGP